VYQTVAFVVLLCAHQANKRVAYTLYILPNDEQSQFRETTKMKVFNLNNQA